MEGVISSSHKLISTLAGRMRLLHLVPSQILPFAVSQNQSTVWAMYRAIASPEWVCDRRMAGLNAATPPSSSEWPLTESHHSLPLIIFPIIADTRLGNLDPLRRHNEIVLTWQPSAPTFSSDINVYIREQHKQLPVKQYAYIYLEEECHVKTSRLIIVFGSADCLRRLSEFRSNREIYAPPSGVQDSRTWSVTSEIIFSICAVFRVLIWDTTKFSRNCSLEIEEMVSTTFPPLCRAFH
jgi:hypothetical protein